MVPRANVTSTSGQEAADAGALRIDALNGAAQVVTTAAPSKRANWRALTSQMLTYRDRSVPPKSRDLLEQIVSGNPHLAPLARPAESAFLMADVPSAFQDE